MTKLSHLNRIELPHMRSAVAAVLAGGWDHAGTDDGGGLDERYPAQSPAVGVDIVDAILADCGHSDETVVLFKRGGENAFILFAHGNGDDVIADCTDNVDAMLAHS